MAKTVDDSFVKIPVETFYLEMHTPPAAYIQLPEDVTFVRWQAPPYEEYMNIYAAVGDEWGWSGRKVISQNEVEAAIHHPDTIIYKMVSDDQVVGFFELRKQHREIELVYMGVLPEAIGKGFGKLLLNQAIKKAWEENIDRFWLHTCTFDHAKAFSVYQKAGFVHYKTNIVEEYYPKDFLDKHGR